MKKIDKTILIGRIFSIIGASCLILVLITMVYFKITQNIFQWDLIILLLFYTLFVISMPIISNYSNKLLKKKLKESEKMLKLKMNQVLTYSIFGLGVGITYVFNGLDNGNLYNTIVGLIILTLALIYFTAGYERRFAILHKRYSKEKPLKY